MELGIRVSVPAQVEREGEAVVPGRLLLDVVRVAAQGGALARVPLVAAGRRGGVGHREVPSAHAAARGLPQASGAGRLDDAGPLRGVRRDDQPRRSIGVAGRDAPPPHGRAGLGLRQGAADGRDRLVPAVGQGDLARRGRSTASSRRTCRPAPCRSSAGWPAATTRRPRSRSPRSRTRSSSRVGDTVLSSRLVEGRFPNYRQLLPESFEHELRLSTAELLEVVRRISLLAQKNAPLRMAFSDGALEVSAQTPDVGEASESLPVPFKGEPLEIGFNPEFLRDGLESAESDELLLKLISPLRPGPDPVGRRRRLHVPRDADPPERVAPCASHASARATSATSSGPRRRWATRSPSCTGRTGPARRTCSRRSTSAARRRSCRTSNERELVRFGAKVARVEVEVEAEDGAHRLEVGLEPGEAKRVRMDGAALSGPAGTDVRPLVSVFMPDRLDLVKGAPALRRAHLDQLDRRALAVARGEPRGLCARACPAERADRAGTRGSRGARRCSTPGMRSSRRPAIALMADRAEACALVAPRFADRAGDLGLPDEATLAYRPRSRAADADALRARAARAPRRGPRARLLGPRAPPRRGAARARRAGPCAPTDPRGSSGSAYSRCCSPSATPCSTRAAARR